jgi:hypothetical protein
MLGILLALWIPLEYIPGMKWFISAGFMSVILLFSGVRFSAYRYRMWFGFIVHLFFIILGVFLVQMREVKNEKHKHFENNKGHLVGTVLRRQSER